MTRAHIPRLLSAPTALFVLFVPFLCSPAPALETDRLKVQRKEVFEFTEKPSVTREGDRITITFAAKAFCDATVAVENAHGKIIRHLASGVLGANAPPPFQKNSLKQTLVWDSKDEIGRYVDDKDSHTVRVSLGLKPRFERTLYWSGHKMSGGSRATLNLSIKAAPEGVYVFSAGQGDQLKLFDHDGSYVRTIYPFPADKVANVVGLKWQQFPPYNDRLPSKLINQEQDTFLPDKAVRDIAVQGTRLCMVSSIAMPAATDGSTGGMNLNGPLVGYEADREMPNGEGFFRPYSAALSPDATRLYLACYTMIWQQPGYPSSRAWYHGVNVVDLAAGGQMKPFAGVMTGKDAPGSDNAHFKCPMSVACDAKGRVYVADNVNDRIQVYLPDGRFYKSVAIERPGIVRVNPKTGEICVISSSVLVSQFRAGDFGGDTRKPGPISVTFLGPVDDPTVKTSYPLDLPYWDYSRNNSVYDISAEVDFYTDPPTVWTSAAAAATSEPPNIRCNARLWQPQGRKLALKRDFAAEAEKTIVRSRAPHFGRPRLWASPADRTLYLGLIGWDSPVACKSFSEVLKIDPATGIIKAEQMPTNAEDIGFDWEGRVYLRSQDAITRFDPVTWREIPYDYGEKRIVCHDDGGAKPYKAISAVVLPSCIGGMFHMGGFGVNAQGNAAVSCINPNDPAAKKLMKEKNVQASGGPNPYTPPIYPGRNAGWETHIFDAHGNLLKADVAPGIGVSNFLQIDRDNNVYILCASTPYLGGKPYFNGRGCTLIKIVPGKMKCLTPGGVIPLAEAARPTRPFDITRPGLWVEGAEWLFGPVGADGHYGSGGKCSCYVNGRFALDYFGRSFAPEVDRFRAVVLDSNGNVITRIGKYGNVDDGLPLVKDRPSTGSLLRQGSGGQAGQAAPPNPRSIGGDEVAIMHAMNVAVDTDRRFFLADIGNQCIRSVKLGYHAEEKVALKDVKETKTVE